MRHLKPNEVHIWAFTLPEDTTAIDLYETHLTSEELQRSHRIISQTHRFRFTYFRSKLREILASYTKIRPKNLKFMYSEDGKPHLKGIEFNLSHSRNRALLGITSSFPIGIDLEILRPHPNLLKMAQRIFSSSSVKLLQALPEPLKTRTFLKIWTFHEAYAKGRGKSLWTMTPEKEALNILTPQTKKIMIQDWNVQELDTEADSVAALATQHSEIEIIYCS